MQSRAAYEDLMTHRAVFAGERFLPLATVDVRTVQASRRSSDALVTFLSGPDRLEILPYYLWKALLTGWNCRGCVGVPRGPLRIGARLPDPD